MGHAGRIWRRRRRPRSSRGFGDRRRFHQLTAQEVSQFGRRGLKPIVFVLNNSGYLIERLLRKDPTIEYNDLASWRYSELPQALGCDDWFTARVETCGELDRALEEAQTEAPQRTSKLSPTPMPRRLLRRNCTKASRRSTDREFEW
jgi:TPP-dependent 2-oxoacid decarboxylase